MLHAGIVEARSPRREARGSPMNMCLKCSSALAVDRPLQLLRERDSRHIFIGISVRAVPWIINFYNPSARFRNVLCARRPWVRILYIDKPARELTSHFRSVLILF